MKIFFSLWGFILFFYPCSLLAYDIVWLGDMHYDETNLHTPDYFENKKRERHLKTLQRNLHSWEGTAPSYKLLEAAGATAKGTPFAFQIGDFAHGHAGSQSLATAMYDKAIKLIAGKFQVPVYFTPGNHEYVGIGAKQVDILLFLTPKILSYYLTSISNQLTLLYKAWNESDCYTKYCKSFGYLT